MGIAWVLRSTDVFIDKTYCRSIAGVLEVINFLEGERDWFLQRTVLRAFGYPLKISGGCLLKFPSIHRWDSPMRMKSYYSWSVRTNNMETVMCRQSIIPNRNVMSKWCSVEFLDQDYLVSTEEEIKEIKCDNSCVTFWVRMDKVNANSL